MTDDAATILLVEDDALLRDAFRLLLEEAGYTVLEAGSAADALSQVAEHAPALLILDLGLPDESGLNVARALRAQQETRATPIVALTGHAGAAEERACMRAGCTTYFAKPVEPEELLNRLPDLLT